ncbi:TadE family protein [Cohnella sp. JJ-181]|uniref:TadE family protein n=1 Tax=Cohnella rhizoplanae TaxID=2974897 RepID=UPI0023306E3D|nr:TadE/TadG family type IV pilus assembly protein [Cohnella sp. JJ-181]
MDTSRRRSGNEGSLTLEAALTMPIVMICVLFLIYLIHASIVSMALQGALSQTARQTAAVWYPLAESIAEAQAATGSEPGSAWKDRLAGTQETVGKIAPYLPEPLSTWAGHFADGSWYPDALAAKLALEPRVAERLRKSMVQPSRMKLTKVELPDAEDSSRAFLVLEAEYRLPFSFPWSGRPLILRASVRERVWTGGERLASAAPTDGQDSGSLAFVSLEPSPVQRGRRITLVLRAEPGASVDLKVVYKSGLSQARHLGTATADAAGNVSWTWLVSGNTTPGEWAWVASYEGGSLQQTFQVQSKTVGKGG